MSEGLVFNMVGGGGVGIKLTGITITTPPAKTTYTAGETFDPAGMVVQATYSNGATLQATGYAYSPSTPLTDGTTKVTIVYTEGGVTKTVEQAITVSKAAGSLSISPTSITLDKTNPAGEIIVDRAGDGAISAVSSAPNIAEVSVSGNIVTVTGKASGNVTITISVAEGTNHTAPASKTCAVTVSIEHIYGVQWDGSSTTALTRTDDAALFADPVPAVGTGSGSSPFDSCLPWSGMAKVTDGNNVLVAIPKFWVKVTHSPFKVQIANQATDGFQVSPAHRDRGDGVGERDVVYIGRYECNSSYYSKTGQSPKVSTDLPTFRSGIKALGTGYYQADYALQLTLWYLYLVEFADWNGQSKIGLGNVDSGAVINTGGTDSMTYHTGRASGTDGNAAIQYRYIENLWGNAREWRDGIIFSGENMCTYNNPANFADTYNATGATVRSNTRPTSSGWITAWGYDTTDNSFIYPSAVGGSNTTYVPDYCDYYSDVRALRVGGNFKNGTHAGPFFLNGSSAPSNTSSRLGSRLQKLPQA